MDKSAIKENVQLFGSIIVIGILLMYIVFQLFIPDMTIRVFGFKPYVVITESMEPVIKVNDMVFVRKFDEEEAEVGDIITFEADIDYNGTKEVVTHYIYSIAEQDGTYYIQTNRYYEEGRDPVPDTWLLTQDDVLGTYWFQVNKLGFLTEFLKSPFGIAAVVVNIGIIGAIVYLIKQGKPEEDKQEETTEEKE